MVVGVARISRTGGGMRCPCLYTSLLKGEPRVCVCGIFQPFFDNTFTCLILVYNSMSEVQIDIWREEEPGGVQ